LPILGVKSRNLSAVDNEKILGVTDFSLPSKN